MLAIAISYAGLRINGVWSVVLAAGSLWRGTDWAWVIGKFAVVMMFLVWRRLVMLESVRYHLRTQASTVEGKAMASLLKSGCDVTLEIDSEFQLFQGSAQSLLGHA